MNYCLLVFFQELCLDLAEKEALLIRATELISLLKLPKYVTWLLGMFVILEVILISRWLVAERSRKKRIVLPGAVRGQYAFLRICKFWRENF